MLKNLVVAFDDPGVLQVAQAAGLTETQRDALLHGHSLQKLWNHLRPAVQALGNAVPAETIEGVGFYTFRTVPDWWRYTPRCAECSGDPNSLE